MNARVPSGVNTIRPVGESGVRRRFPTAQENHHREGAAALPAAPPLLMVPGK